MAYLTNWLNLRIAYLDSVFNSRAATTTAFDPSGAGTLYDGTSVTLGAKVTGTSPSGTVTFIASGAVIGTGTLGPNGFATTTTASLPTGTIYLEAVYNGDNVNALSTSPYRQVTVMPALTGSVTSIAGASSAATVCTAVNFTLSALGISGTTLPTGTVTLKVNGTAVGSPSALFNGVAIVSATLPGGAASIQAVYSGDGTYQTSSSNVLSVPVSASCGTPLPTPTFSLASGAYVGTQSVSIMDTNSAAKIYYTTDGTTPTTASPLYSTALQLRGSASPYGAPIVLQAIAVLSGSTNSAVATALYSVQVSFPAAPSVGSATPNPASGLSNTFTLQYSDTFGAAYLNTVGVMFSSIVSTSYSCTVNYSPATNLIALLNDTGEGFTSVAPGTGTLSNSQCTINASGTSVVINGNNLTLNVSVTVSSSFSGKHSIFMLANDNSSATTGWVNNGTWTPTPNQPPALVSATLTPASGPTTTLTLTYSDPNGASDLSKAEVILSPTLTETDSCVILYSPTQNLVYLLNDAGTGSSSLTPANGTISNSQCTIVGTNTLVALSGDTLTLTVEVTASSTYTATQNIYMYAIDNSSAKTGWVNEGSWTP